MNLETLNPKQREAVETIGGPILVFAGAGSGKTRVLTHKIAYLIEEIGLAPENILAVTFTNKAAGEMKERVQQLLSVDASKMSVGTFHSISARLLRRDIPLLGYTRDFGIYDQTDSKALVKQVIKELNLDPKQFDAKSYQSKISGIKNQMISPSQFKEFAEGFLDEKFSEIYLKYQTLLKTNNALDFDDLLLKPIELFKEYPEKLQQYQNQYKYVLVDEYQDTNKPQFELVYSISKEHRDVCVVGDDDQSIYGWRGADIKNILEFEKHFGGSTVIKLEQNYRSTQTILDAAWAVVSNNTTRAEKKLWTENSTGAPIKLLDCFDERDEAKQVLKVIQNEYPHQKNSFNDIVILYRTNAQSRVIEDEFRRQGVPYQIIGGVKFYERKEIKDVLAYLKLLVNPNDSISFERVINFPARGLGNTTIQKIRDIAQEKQISMFESLDYIENLNIGPKQKSSLSSFRGMMKRIQEMMTVRNAYEICTEVIDAIELHGFYENLGTPEADERWNNIEELVNSITEFVENKENSNLRDFLEEVSLLTDIDRWNEGDSAVSMMTIHSSKGLEFPIVFSCGLEDGLFPLGGSQIEDREMDEERRLFYVAVTRAEKKVILSYANNRRRFGGPPTPTLVSRFINEIPENLMESIEKSFDKYIPKRTFKPERTFSKSKVASNTISVGDEINHKMFGKGSILAVEGVGESAKYTILFQGNVRKKLIAKYANLQKI